MRLSSSHLIGCVDTQRLWFARQTISCHARCFDAGCKRVLNARLTAAGVGHPVALWVRVSQAKLSTTWAVAESRFDTVSARRRLLQAGWGIPAQLRPPAAWILLRCCLESCWKCFKKKPTTFDFFVSLFKYHINLQNALKTPPHISKVKEIRQLVTKK